MVLYWLSWSMKTKWCITERDKWQEAIDAQKEEASLQKLNPPRKPPIFQSTQYCLSLCSSIICTMLSDKIFHSLVNVYFHWRRNHRSRGHGETVPRIPVGRFALSCIITKWLDKMKWGVAERYLVASPQVNLLNLGCREESLRPDIKDDSCHIKAPVCSENSPIIATKKDNSCGAISYSPLWD